MFLILEADTLEAGEQAWFKLWSAVSSTLSAKPFVEPPMAPWTWWSQQTLWEVQRAWGGLGMVPHSPDPVWAHAVSRVTSLRARLPSIPPPAQTCSRHGAASAGGSACMWGGDTWLPTLYLITPHMLATGPTAFRSPGSPGVCPACLQGVVGRSVARQNTELHEDRADRGAQRAQLCLHHRPVSCQTLCRSSTALPRATHSSWHLPSGVWASWGGQTLWWGRRLARGADLSFPRRQWDVLVIVTLLQATLSGVCTRLC